MSGLRVGLLVMALAAAAPQTVAAQRSRQAPVGDERRGPQNRAQLEQRVRREFYRTARTRIGLTDDQMRQLGAVNAKYEGQRRTLNREERQTRVALRTAIQSNVPQDQAKIDGYMNTLQQLDRRRMELNESEQRDLAGFMTPLQRAQYRALQDAVRRRMEELRRARRDSVRGEDFPGPPTR